MELEEEESQPVRLVFFAVAVLLPILAQQL
jgi:hypothetical protein